MNDTLVAEAVGSVVAEGLDAELVGARFVDRDVTLSSLTLTLPEEPVTINGQNYGFEVADGLLARAVNRANSWESKGHKYPVAGITIEYGETLPLALTGRQKDRLPLLYDGNTFEVKCTVPQEVVKSSEQADALVALYEKALNEQLQRGILQSIASREALTGLVRRNYAALYAGHIVGMVAGITVPPEQIAGRVTNVFERGAIGAVMGLVIVLVGIAVKQGFWHDSFERLSRKVPSRADRKLQNSSPRSYNPLERSFSKHPIRLIPAVLPEVSPVDEPL